MGRDAGERAGRDVAGPHHPYPAGAVRDFVAACAATADQRAACRCTIERLQRTLPYADFARADRAFRDERPLPAATRRAIEAATAACRDDS